MFAGAKTMINLKTNPVEWAGLMYELDDLKEHLESLMAQMNESGEIEVEDYRVQIGHLYAHLNRSWNSRNATANAVEKNFDKLTKFPTDIETYG